MQHTLTHLLSPYLTENTMIFFYGIINGVYFTAAVIPILIAFTYLNKRYDRHIFFSFLFIGLSFLGFGFHTLFFERAHNTVIAAVLPEWLFQVGRLSIPAVLAFLSFAYVRVIRMMSYDAYNFSIRIQKVEYAVYGLYGFIFVLLLVTPSLYQSILMILFCFIVASFFGFILSVISIGQAKALGMVLSAGFFVSCVGSVAISMMWAMKKVEFIEPYIALFTLFFGFVLAFFCVLLLRFGYNYVRKYTFIQSIDTFNIVNDIIFAVKNNQLELHYQPQYCLKTQKLVGVEALVRWQHPTKGLIPPEGFIGVAEHVALIDYIARWVIDAALATCKQFLATEQPMVFSINLSVMNLNDGVLNHLAACMKKYAVPAGLVNIEITESFVLNNDDKTIAALEKIRRLGVSLTIDDYGVGFSSLGYFQKFAINELKIDRSFVIDLLTSQDSYEIVKSTIQMSKNLGIRCVAEGVEDRQVLPVLRQLGCDVVQGYGIAEPMPLATFKPWLQQHAQQINQMIAIASYS